MGGGRLHRVFTDRIQDLIQTLLIRPKRSKESLGLCLNYSDTWFKRLDRLGSRDVSGRTVQSDETQLAVVPGTGARRCLEKR